MKKYLSILLAAALSFAAGCLYVSSGIDAERIGTCSWSWRSPLTEVLSEMDSSGIKGIQLALGPFIHPDGRHGNAEDLEIFEKIKAKAAKGEIVIMSTMVGTVGEDYSTLETIKKTGGIVPDEHWQANQKIITEGAKLTASLRCKYMSTHAGFLDESDESAFKKYVERVSWMRDECRKYGVELILESGQETAEDLAVFMKKVPGVGIIAGSYVQDGKVTRQAQIRVVRDGVVIFEDKISSLKRFKDDAREVAAGYECGIGLEKFNDIKVGDILEAFVMEQIEQ